MCLLPPSYSALPSGRTKVFGDDVDRVVQANPDAVIIVTGDLNQLNYNALKSDYGLQQMVQEPTHGKNILDVFLTNRSDLVRDVSIVSSLIKTKHKAVFINTGRIATNTNNINALQHVRIFDRKPIYLERLCSELRSCNWAALELAISCNCITVGNAFTEFGDIVKAHVASAIPTRSVTMGMKDPSFVTPFVKSLLKKRNILRRAGRLTQADNLAIRINDIIVEGRSKTLTKAAASNIKELWALLKKTKNWGSRCAQQESLGDVNYINA